VIVSIETTDSIAPVSNLIAKEFVLPIIGIAK